MAMPSKATVDAFIALVESGDYVGAIEQFYTADASTRENHGAPRVGRDNLMAIERQVMAAHKQIEARRLAPVLIEADHVAVIWRFEFTTLQGTVRTLEEVAWQKWRGEQLVEEQFFYDPQQMIAEKSPSRQEAAAQ
jgi:SnoaL-like domain